LLLLTLAGFVLWALLLAFVFARRFTAIQGLIVAAFVVAGYLAYPPVKEYFVRTQNSEGYQQLGDGFFAVVLTTSIGAWIGALLATVLVRRSGGRPS
jgi:hypothetical protein